MPSRGLSPKYFFTRPTARQSRASHRAAKPEGKRQNIQRQLPRSHPGGEAGMLSAKIFKGNYREVTRAAKPEGKRQNIQGQLPRSHPGGEAGMLSAKIFKGNYRE